MRSLLGVFLRGIMILIALASIASSEDEPLNVQEKVKLDSNMQTKQYQTDIILNTDGSYFVKEKIDVQFIKPQYGIYRNIPVKGLQYYEDKAHKKHKFLYYTKIKLKDVNTDKLGWFQNGNYVLDLGDGRTKVNGGNYQFSYRLTPYHDEKDYHNIYYHVLPGQWRNPFPKGSSFTIHFPKKVKLSKLNFYSGENGQTVDARKVADIKIDSKGCKVTGTLTKDLPLGWGITCFGDLGKGYFTSTAKPDLGKNTLLASGICLGILVIFFIKFGRNDKIKSSVRFQPPDLDSAAVACIIRGRASDCGVVSLLLDWASQGYVFLKEEQNEMTIYKLKDLPSDVPEYQTYFFENLFTEEKPFLATSDIPERMNEVMERTTEKINDCYKNKIYAKGSGIARGISFFLTIAPISLFMMWSTQFGVLNQDERYIQMFSLLGICGGALILNVTVDIWHYVSGSFRKKTAVVGGVLCGGGLLSFIIFYSNKVLQSKVFNFTGVMFLVCGVTLAEIFLTAFMKKRTKQCVEWLRYLVGFRNFIENAEMDRMRILGKQYPNLLYRLLPYAYVFGLSETYAQKMEELNMEMPVWFDCFGSHLTFQYQSLFEFSDSICKYIGSPGFSDSDSREFTGGE